MNKEFLKFPDGFLWGSATSAHQIEGNNDNDWSHWEKSLERIRKLKDGGHNPDEYISGAACDSYNRYGQDFDIAKSLGHNCHRISIEWSRIEPERGKFDEDAIQHYIDVVKDIRAGGMESIVTLWHFTSPKWFTDGGGFEKNDSVQHYKTFIRKTVENLKPYVGLWITFNEATSVWAPLGYLKGTWPPAQKNPIAWLKVRRNIMRAHMEAYREIKSIYSDEHNESMITPPLIDLAKKQVVPPLLGPSQITSHNITKGVGVGLVENHGYLALPKLLEVIGLGKLIKYFYYYSVWRQLLPSLDFIGLNYYTVYRMPFFGGGLKRQTSDNEMGWEVYPEGLYHVLMDLKKFNKPLLVTENGIADKTDLKRFEYISSHLKWLYRAISDGANVRGYLYWSLLDNFEWARGYLPRFGLVHVDYKSLERKIRPSAYKYSEIIKQNGINAID